MDRCNILYVFTAHIKTRKKRFPEENAYLSLSKLSNEYNKDLD